MEMHRLEATYEDGRLRVMLDGQELMLAASHPCLKVEFDDQGVPHVCLHLLCDELALDLDDVDIEELHADGVELVRQRHMLRRTSGVPATPFAEPGTDDDAEDGES